jgi:hypothetical protein
MLNVLADIRALLLLETFFAKEARNYVDCWGKPLDCSKRGLLGIKVWTKW